MKCDELKAEQWLDYSGKPMPCYPKAKVDEAIAELKQKLEDAKMSEKLYVVTFHAEDFQDSYSKRTIIKKAKSLDELLDELEKSWLEVNPNIRIVADFIFSEECR